MFVTRKVSGRPTPTSLALMRSAELADVATFAAAQPQTCPRCHATVRRYFMPGEIVPDVRNCDALLPRMA